MEFIGRRKLEALRLSYLLRAFYFTRESLVGESNRFAEMSSFFKTKLERFNLEWQMFFNVVL